MENKNKIFSEEDLKNDDTGSHGKIEPYNIINYEFDKYEIKVKVTPDNKFIGIDEVGVRKDFRDIKKRMPKDFHDIDDIYVE